MIVHNVDASYRVYKHNNYLVIDDNEGVLIVLYQNDIKRLRQFLRRFK